MMKFWQIPVAALFVLAAPTAALAARGYATTDVNMRAGPERRTRLSNWSRRTPMSTFTAVSATARGAT